MIRTALKSVDTFLFPARSTAWIGWLRIGLGAAISVYSISLWSDWSYLFASGSDGLVSRELSEDVLSLDSSLLPRLGWFVALGAKVGLGEAMSLRAVLGLLLASGIFLIGGLFSRPAAISAWLIHLAARGSGAFTSYGVDHFLTTGLFYLMVCPMPDCHSLDSRLFRSKQVNPYRVGFHQRLLQLHLCLIYFFAGLAKALGPGWWNGNSIWRALTRAPFDVVSPDFLVRWSLFFPVVGLAIWLLELGYPLFIWPRRTRALGLIAITAMHAGIGVTMGLYLFALVLIVLNLAAFAPELLVRRSPSHSGPHLSRT